MGLKPVIFLVEGHERSSTHVQPGGQEWVALSGEYRWLIHWVRASRQSCEDGAIVPLMVSIRCWILRARASRARVLGEAE